MRFTDKVAVVTGGATGIGRAAVEAFAAEGAAVAIGDINVAKANEAVDQIQRQGGKALFVEADVSLDSEAPPAGRGNGGRLWRGRCSIQ